jgi:hypothetical protein
VLGKTRAKQFYSDDAERTQSAAVLLHGDGAFSGQGIVFETLDLCGLFDYTVGGTIHLVVNNQVTEGGHAAYAPSSCRALSATHALTLVSSTALVVGQQHHLYASSMLVMNWWQLQCRLLLVLLLLLLCVIGCVHHGPQGEPQQPLLHG